MIFEFKKLSRKENLILLIACGIFIGLYIIRLISGHLELSDSLDYLNASESIKNGDYFIRNTQFENAFIQTRRPFFYPLFLTVFSSLKLEIILFIQTVIGMLNVYLMMQLHKKFNLNVPYYFIILLLFTPAIFIYTQLIMTEWLVMSLLLFLAILLLSGWSKKRFLLIQIITTLLAFTKPVFYPLVYLNLIYFSVYFYKKKTFSLSILIPVICMWSYLAFNNYRTGYTHFTSLENTNLIDYNLYYFKSSTESKEIAEKWVQSIYNESEKYPDFEHRSVFIKREAVKEIRAHFFSYSWYHFYTGLRGIFDPGRFDLMTFYKKENGKQGFMEILNSKKSIWTLIENSYFYIYLLLVPVFFTQLIKIFCTIGYVISMKHKINFLNFYLIIFTVSYILITGPVNCSRLMMPFQGIFIVIATLGIHQMIRDRSKTNLISKP